MDKIHYVTVFHKDDSVCILPTDGAVPRKGEVIWVTKTRNSDTVRYVVREVHWSYRNYSENPHDIYKVSVSVEIHVVLYEEEE